MLWPALFYALMCNSLPVWSHMVRTVSALLVSWNSILETHFRVSFFKTTQQWFSFQLRAENNRSESPRERCSSENDNYISIKDNNKAMSCCMTCRISCPKKKCINWEDVHRRYPGVGSVPHQPATSGHQHLEMTITSPAANLGLKDWETPISKAKSSV